MYHFQKKRAGILFLLEKEQKVKSVEKQIIFLIHYVKILAKNWADEGTKSVMLTCFK